MAYASAEKDFYQRHYKGGLRIQKQGNVDAIYRDHYAPGKRYNLLLTELQQDRQYGAALEIGCANGECIRYLSTKFQFERVVGLDIAFPDGDRQVVEGVEFLQANSNNSWPLKDGSVDVIAAMMVFEHLFDPFHAFSEVKRLLTPDGKAIVNLPLVTSIKNRFRLLCGKVPVTSVAFDRWIADREWDGNHLHYFSLESIRRLADSCGLEVSRTAGVGSYHRVKSLAPTFLANELTFVLQHKR